ncbi:MAG: response regulator [Candidatus Omnitrophica bacterium]|nr:response regulator [Candidatus Omnitrophota bacterium]
MRKEKILIIDDDPDILDVLELTLSDNYIVISAKNGKDGLDLVKSKGPDLVISDYNMPIMTGPEFCRNLRKDILLRHLPVIMLTGKGETKDMVMGIEAGADDYLIKPFEPETLLARIRMILNRTMRSLDANPLTHLPGNPSIMDELQNSIDSGKIFAVGYVDLDKFKIYNDQYGFEHGDEIIRETARILIEATQGICGNDAFVGHIGGDDFVFICDNAKADAVAAKIVEDFDQASPSFYNETDRQAGFILGRDRQGTEIKTGFVYVSIGIVSNDIQKITHIAQIGEIGAELKKFAKSVEKSVFVRDQRRKESNLL